MLEKATVNLYVCLYVCVKILLSLVRDGRVFLYAPVQSVSASVALLLDNKRSSLFELDIGDIGLKHVKDNAPDVWVSKIVCAFGCVCVREKRAALSYHAACFVCVCVYR